MLIAAICLLHLVQAAALKLDDRPRSLPVILVHIHKGFGSWACQQAAFSNGESVVAPADNCNWIPHDTHARSIEGHTVANTIAELRVKHMTSGGFTFGMIERPLWAEDYRWTHFHYAVLMRHPLKEMDSNLNYEIARDDHKDAWWSLSSLKRALGLDPDSKGDDWLDLLLSMIQHRKQGRLLNNYGWSSWKALDNFKIRVLVAEAWTLPPGGVNRTHLEMAVERLNKFYAVGAADEDDVIDANCQLFDRLRWTNVSASLKVNTAPFAKLNLTRGREEVLRRLNALDFELYEHARALAEEGQGPARRRPRRFLHLVE